jgi:DNA repair exonuclease SbcCD ATPase subunit
MDANTQQQLLSTLKELETHVTYLRSGVEKITSLQESLQEMKLEEAKRAANIVKMSETLEELSKKMDGPSGDSPLPSRLKNLEDQIKQIDLPNTLNDQKASIDALETRVTSLSDKLDKMEKDDADMRKERYKAKIAIAMSIIAFIGVVITNAVKIFA